MAAVLVNLKSKSTLNIVPTVVTVGKLYGFRAGADDLFTPEIVPSLEFPAKQSTTPYHLKRNATTGKYKLVESTGSNNPKISPPSASLDNTHYSLVWNKAQSSFDMTAVPKLEAPGSGTAHNELFYLKFNKSLQRYDMVKPHNELLFGGFTRKDTVIFGSGVTSTSIDALGYLTGTPNTGKEMVFRVANKKIEVSYISLSLALADGVQKEECSIETNLSAAQDVQLEDGVVVHVAVDLNTEKLEAVETVEIKITSKIDIEVTSVSVVGRVV